MPKVTSLSLFQLIHAMTKAEKRHFKLYAHYHSSSNHKMNYVHLFDSIEKQKIYDEEKIKQSGIVKREYLPMLKNYLHNLILESMRVLESKGNDIDTRLSNMLHHARIMRRKGLTEEEFKFLTKVKKLALKHERWITALEALMSIRKVMTRKEEKNTEQVDEEIRGTFMKLSNLHDYLKIHSRVDHSLKKSEVQRGHASEAVKQLMKHPLLGNEAKGLSAEAKRLYYSSRSQYYYFTGDYRRFYKLFIKNVRFVENNLSTLEFPELAYSSALNNLTIAQCMLKKHKDALITIAKHRSVIKKDETAMMHAFMYSNINETNYYLATGNFEKGKHTVEKIEKEIARLASAPYTQQVSLVFNMAYIYFGSGNFHKSLECINKIINQTASGLREDIQVWSHILRILIHYELNTKEIIPHLLITSYRFLLKREQLHKVEENILIFIQRLIKTDTRPISKTALKPSKKALLIECRRFHHELLLIIRNPEEKKALHYFDLISWLESKMENRSFSNIVREKSLSGNTLQIVP